MEIEKQKIYSDKKKLIESELIRTKDILSKMLDKLPNEELPFMENHLRALYFETYFLLAEGFYNAALVLCGILLETVIKEKLFIEGIKDENLENINFGQAINKCKEKDFLTDEEISFLEDKKEKLRNPYAHYNKIKLSKGIYFHGWKIENPVEKLKELGERVKGGEITEEQARKELIKGVPAELISSEELRPLSQIAKSEMERKGAVNIFLEIDKFVRDFATKYFKPVTNLLREKN